MGILASERAAGYRDGIRTISQVAVDEAHEEGRLEGLREAGSDLKLWCLFSFLGGFAAAALFHGLVLS